MGKDLEKNWKREEKLANRSNSIRAEATTRFPEGGLALGHQL